nr:uncharacterized protein CTRU02_06161 [Colletotrichum truncatum]KAF6793289.1 hypothetical protein CTRU02_06161 [Colletotrichum truncatum]
MLTSSGFDRPRSYLLIFIAHVISIVMVARQRQGSVRRPREYDAVPYLHAVASLFYVFSEIGIFLALFHLGHALTQLRTGAVADESKAYRNGRKAVFGVSVLIALLGLAVFAVMMVFNVMNSGLGHRSTYSDWDKVLKWNQVGSYIYLAKAIIWAIASFGIVCCVFKARKEAKNSPVHKAGSLLGFAAFIWLTSFTWALVDTIVRNFASYGMSMPYIDIFDVLIYTWAVFIVLALLYTLAAKDAYGLSRTHYEVTKNERAA